MADRELAAKLAKRLACTETEDEPATAFAPPPPCPEIPKKIVENPFVAVDNTFSVDDLILKTLEMQEENNNSNQKSMNPTPPAVSPTPSSSSGPVSPSSSTAHNSQLPPRTTIRDLLLRDQAQQEVAAPKNPVVPIEHHKKPVVPEVKKKSPEVDGSELEKKLAAQRAKRPQAIEELIENKRKDSFEELEEQMQREVEEEEKRRRLAEAAQRGQGGQSGGVQQVQGGSQEAGAARGHAGSALAEDAHQQQGVPVQPQAEAVVVQQVQEVPQGSQEAAEVPVVDQPAQEGSQEAVPASQVQEVQPVAAQRTQEVPAPQPVVPSVEETKKEENEEREKKTRLVPSPLLIEAIQREFGGIKSPPPPTAPKPQTPTHSRPQSPVVVGGRPVSPGNVQRPQSPVVKKPFVSPLGLLCDPLMSVEAPASPKLPQSPKVVKKPKEENAEELAALLERRAKINEGEEVPQFVNRKLSLYAEFSEFSRKQIKFFSDTFKKYDEDEDGFIDFNELKRMMERLGEAQTHIALKDIIKKVDEDLDGKINMREFLLLFRLAAKGELGCSEVFTQLAESVDVAKEGVLAAASFFQAKIAEQTKLSKFEEEIKQEQEERKREEEERKQRREQFLQKKSIFH